MSAGGSLMTAPVGLARRTLGGGSLFFFAVSASAPMTVVAGGVVATYASTGVVAVPAAFPIITAALLFFSVGYVALARYVPHAGPLYAHVARGLGPAPGLAAAALALLGYIAIGCSLYGLIGSVVSSLFGGEWWGWALAACGAVAILGSLHIGVNAKVLAALLAGEIAVVVLFDLAAFIHPFEGALSFEPLLPANLIRDGIGGVLGLTVAAFIGYESALAYGEEARDHRAVARATLGSLLFIGLLYAASSWAMAVAVGPSRVVEVARSPDAAIPFAVVSTHYGMLVGALCIILLVTSVFAALLSFHHTAARYIFVLSRERVLPAALGRIGRGAAAGAPVGGSLLQSSVALVVIVVCAAAGADPLATLFTQLSTLAAIALLTLMLVVCLAVLRFYRRGGGTNESTWVRVVAPFLGALALAAILATTVANLRAIAGVPWLIPAIVVGCGLAGLVWGLVVRHWPDRGNSVGRGEPEPLAELEQRFAGVDV
jgi:amino acid transporter